jgi:hypothetical protein
MITTEKLLILIFTGLLINRQSIAQNNWELKKQASGISVYTSNVEGSEFKAFKSVTTIAGSNMSELAAPMLDVENCKNIFPDTRECRYIKKYGDGNFIQYQITDLPWPVDDRDGIYEIKSQYNKAANEVIINVKCIKYDYPKSGDAIRMSEGDGFWKVKEIKKELFEITYQFHANPAGKIPAWLVNSFIVDNPFNTMLNLKSVIAKGNYKNAKVDFIK